MEINSSYPRREYGGGVPSICTEDFGRSRRSQFSPPLSSSIAMSIPGPTNPYADVPPPLPPPKYPPIEGHPDSRDPQDCRRHDTDDHFPDDTRQHYKMRDNPYGHQDADEGYHSIGSARTLNSPHFSMHHAYRSAPDSGIDSSMLNKLNARRILDNRSPSRWQPHSVATVDSRPPRPTLPKLLSLPVRSRLPQPILDSPHRYTQTPVIAEVSPRSNPFGHLSAGYRSPISTELSDLERSPNPRSTRTNSGSGPDELMGSTHGSFDNRDDEIDFPMEETSRLHRLNIEDSIRERERDRGQKRRASSPPCDDPPLHSDLFRRRDGTGVSRGSPTPRLAPIPQSSVSSVSSAGRSEHSLISLATASMTSMTSMGSFSRRSPPARSPVSPSDAACYDNSYGGFAALSRRSSNSRAGAMQQQQQQQQQPHQRALSDLPHPGQSNLGIASPRKLTDPPASNAINNNNSNGSSNSNNIAAKMQGFYMCECCPKKPKKFETKAQLRAHELEKQYECAYCGNRFKNKNEAERHQNSLHVRRHSWSCSALTAYERAFHESTTRPGEADTCGYCGDEFSRNGPTGPPNQGRFTSDQDWEERILHLQDIHKFRECNSSKKFFRADHFRQHLKHSHAGTSGKWTNMLENACMIEEDPPTVGAR